MKSNDALPAGSKYLNFGGQKNSSPEKGVISHRPAGIQRPA